MLARATAASLPLLLLAACSAPDEVTDSCFVPGTRVSTPGGPRAIEDLVVGDRVVVHEPITGATSVGIVTATHRALVREVRTIRAGGTIIRGVTRAHPFFDVDTQVFVRAEDLRVGGRLLMVDGEATHPVRIDAIEAHELAEPLITVVNLTIGEAPPMFIAEGLVVHNKRPNPCFGDAQPAWCSGDEDTGADAADIGRGSDGGAIDGSASDGGDASDAQIDDAAIDATDDSPG